MPCLYWLYWNSWLAQTLSKKFLTGLLCFFTAGLFFIGTFVDVILLIKNLISFIKVSKAQPIPNNDGIPLYNNYKCEKLCQIRGEDPDILKLKER